MGKKFFRLPQMRKIERFLEKKQKKMMAVVGFEPEI